MDGNQVHSIVLDASSNQILYLHLSVKNEGYFKSGSIEFQDINYKLAGEIEGQEIIASRGGNTIALKQINNNTNAILKMPIAIPSGEFFKVAYIEGESKVKLTGIYVTRDGKEIEIKKEVSLNLIWESSQDFEINSKINMFKVYEKDDKKLTMIQEQINISKTEGLLPIASTRMEINTPELNGEFPDDVVVYSSKTEMTNGKTEDDVEILWQYNKKDGTVVILAENTSEDGRVYNKIGKEDEYVITYNFRDNSASLPTEISKNFKVIIEKYGDEQNNNFEEEIEETEQIEEEFGTIINGITTSKTDINKSKIYANYNSNSNEYETEYTIKELVNIANHEMLERVIIKEQEENFIDQNGNKKSAMYKDADYTYYKKTRITEKNMKDILGEDGYIIIKNGDNEIARIEAKEEAINGVYEVEYKVDNITIETSKPVKAGVLIIENTKAIKQDLIYSKDEVESFQNINTNIKFIANEEVTETIADTVLLEPLGHIRIESDKSVINKAEEELELKVDLGNNNEDSVLYSQPCIRVLLPEFVENVELLNINLLFDTELKIAKADTLTIDEKKVVEIQLEGTQTKFSNLANGTTVVMVLKLINNKFAENGRGEIIASIGEQSAKASIILNLKSEEVENVNLPVEGNIKTDEANDIQDEKDELGPVPILMTAFSQNEELSEGDEIRYTIIVDSPVITENGEKEINNAVLKDVLPQGTTYKTATIFNAETKEFEDLPQSIYNSETREVTIDLGSLVNKENKILNIIANVGKLNSGEYKKELLNKASLLYKGSNEILWSNTTSKNVTKEKLTIIKQTENIGSTNQMGDTIKFILSGQNIGQRASELNININLPEELKPESIAYLIGENEYTGDERRNSVEMYLVNPKPGENYNIELTAKIKYFEIAGTEKTKKLDITGVINDHEINWSVEVENPEYMYTVERNSNPRLMTNNLGSAVTQNSVDSIYTTVNSYKPISTGIQKSSYNVDALRDSQNSNVSGIAWLDENKNGIKEDDEKFLSSITVKLLKENEEIKRTQTDASGSYLFKNVKYGQYQIAFEFDSSIYGVTQYNKTNKSQVNSFAVASYNEGEAITDAISIDQSDIQDVNIGLTENIKFDMNLVKTVNRVIVQNDSGTKIYNSNSNIVKLDIDGELLNSSVVLVEYKLTVKNEGNISGKVTEIVDYMPKDMQFVSDYNKNWVQDSDGNLYTREFSNVDIQPGETMETMLVLRKNMTEDNIGIINNIAEISGTENSENIDDIDSTPKNNVLGEDDIASADVLIGVSAGIGITYILLFAIIIISLPIGMYLIKRNVLDK